MSQAPTPSEKMADHSQSLRRFFLELGPLATFFFVYVGWDRFFPPARKPGPGEVGDDLIAATAVLMIAVVVALALSYRWDRRVPLMPLVTAAMVLIFGGLTILLRNEVFIKMKPTFVNCLFAAVLFGGLAFKKPLLQPLLGHAFQLSADGWRLLSVRWAFFFLFLAGLNEFVWRTFHTDFWVSFKAWGMFPLTLLFAISQVPLIQKHAIEPAGARSAPPG